MMNRFRLFVLAMLCLLGARPSFAQEGNVGWAAPQGSSGGPAIEDAAGAPGLPTDPVAVPIDGGLSLLGAAGAAYAIRRLRRRKQDA